MQTLSTDIIDAVNEYVERDVAERSKVEAFFDFVTDRKLLDELVTAYTSARYIYKLGQALSCSGLKLQAHSKFQITQNASIFEAVITHLLENEFKDHDDVKTLYRDIEYKPIALSIKIKDGNGGEAVVCSRKERLKNKTSIQFDQKVDAIIRVGAMHESLGPDIKRFYSLRNGMHLQNAVKNTIVYDINQSKMSYRRLRPFLVGIRSFLKDGTIPENAMTESALKALIAARKAATKS